MAEHDSDVPTSPPNAHINAAPPPPTDVSAEDMTRLKALSEQMRTEVVEAAYGTEETGWKRIHVPGVTSSAMAISHRQEPGANGYLALKVTTMVHTPASVIARYVLDVEHRKTWDVRCFARSMIAYLQDGLWIEYVGYVGVAGLPAHDFCLLVTHTIDTVGTDECGDEGGNAHLIVAHSIEYNKCAPKPGVQRGIFFPSGWVITPLGGNRGALVTFVVCGLVLDDGHRSDIMAQYMMSVCQTCKSLVDYCDRMVLESGNAEVPTASAASPSTTRSDEDNERDIALMAEQLNATCLAEVDAESFVIDQVNTDLLDYLGLDQAEVQGHRLPDFVLNDDVPQLRRLLINATCEHPTRDCIRWTHCLGHTLFSMVDVLRPSSDEPKLIVRVRDLGPVQEVTTFDLASSTGSGMVDGMPPADRMMPPLSGVAAADAAAIDSDKLTLQRLEQAELSDMSQTGTDVLLRCDRTGVVISAQPDAELLLCYNSGELRGLTWDDLGLCPLNMTRDMFQDQIQRWIDNRDPTMPIVCRLKRKDGSTLESLVRLKRVDDARGNVYMYDVHFRPVPAPQVPSEPPHWADQDVTPINRVRRSFCEAPPYNPYSVPPGARE